MNSIDDLGDMLAEEVLSEMACTFFGSRVEVDEMVELFEQYAEELKQKSEEVSLKAGLLNILLIDSNTINEFYGKLGVKPEDLLDKKTYTKDVLPQKMPFGLTEKSKYIKLILIAYDSLQKACNTYVRGNDIMGYEKEDDKKVSINYTLLMNMSKMINEKIKQVNEKSPVCTLSYTRQLQPEKIEKENIAGTQFSELGCDDLDQKMKIKPLDFESYDIDKYPELPKVDNVKSDITDFGKKVYTEKTSSVEKVISDIKVKMRI